MQHTNRPTLSSVELENGFLGHLVILTTNPMNMISTLVCWNPSQFGVYVTRFGKNNDKSALS